MGLFGHRMQAVSLGELFSDDFNRAAAPVHGNNGWLDVSGQWSTNGAGGGFRVRREPAGAAATDVMFRPGIIADAWAECIVDGSFVGPVVRFAGPPGGYAFYANNTGDIILASASGGGWATLESDAVAIASFSDVLRIHAVSNQIRCYINGSLVLETTDSTWEGGHVGIGGTDTTLCLADDFAWGT